MHGAKKWWVGNQQLKPSNSLQSINDIERASSRRDFWNTDDFTIWPPRSKLKNRRKCEYQRGPMHPCIITGWSCRAISEAFWWPINYLTTLEINRLALWPAGHDIRLSGIYINYCDRPSHWRRYLATAWAVFNETKASHGLIITLEDILTAKRGQRNLFPRLLWRNVLSLKYFFADFLKPENGWLCDARPREGQFVWTFFKGVDY